MKILKLIAITVCALCISFAADAKGSGAARVHYGGGKHTTSHGGTYTGGSGSSHKGGHYNNPSTGNSYGTHK